MTNRRPLVVANWKLHKTRADVREFASILVAGLEGAGAEIVVAPSYPLLDVAASAFAGAPLSIAGQDVSAHPDGAFTGEVSAAQLRDAGCDFVILGHSERRTYHHETNSLVAAKLAAALRESLQPILCIGETLEEREADRTEAIVLGQLDGALEGLDAEALSSLVIAYEPVWAIGTGKNSTPKDAQLVHAAIRRRLHERFGVAFADATRVLYGGSVKPDNAAALLAEPDVDGALVGGASLDADAFLRIVRAAV